VPIICNIHEVSTARLREDLTPKRLTLFVGEVGKEVVWDNAFVSRAPALDMDCGNGRSVIHSGGTDVHSMLLCAAHTERPAGARFGSYQAGRWLAGAPQCVTWHTLPGKIRCHQGLPW